MHPALSKVIAAVRRLVFGPDELTLEVPYVVRRCTVIYLPDDWTFEPLISKDQKADAVNKQRKPADVERITEEPWVARPARSGSDDVAKLVAEKL